MLFPSLKQELFLLNKKTKAIYTLEKVRNVKVDACTDFMHTTVCFLLGICSVGTCYKFRAACSTGRLFSQKRNWKENLSLWLLTLGQMLCSGIHFFSNDIFSRVGSLVRGCLCWDIATVFQSMRVGCRVVTKVERYGHFTDQCQNAILSLLPFSSH